MEYITYLASTCIALAAYALLWILYIRFFHPLKHIPGPFWASITRLWLVHHVLAGDMDKQQRELHKIHGPLIRIAPDEVACADPAAIRKLYPTSKPLTKGMFYESFHNSTFSKYPDHFAVIDERLHRERRRLVNGVYSMSSILTLEPYIDTCSALFLRRMGEAADAHALVDLGDWLQWYAFDVIGELFFGRMFGFMEHSHDHEGYIAALDTLLPLLVARGLAPPVFKRLIAASSKISYSVRKGLRAVDHLAAAARKCVAERLNTQAQSIDEKPRNDLLERLLEIMEEKGKTADFGKGEVEYESYVAIFAGSDTTAIALRSIFQHLMKTPSVYAELKRELDNATTTGRLSLPPTFVEAQKLPYLCAVVKEAMRLHPSVGLTMPRIIPSGGMDVAGYHIPAGCSVGMNAAVVGYDEEIFGPDAETFQPARWLGERGALMDRHNLVFGAGTRTCIGKNISLSEIHKLVPLALQHFDFALDNPDGTWKTNDVWFNKQTEIRVRVYRR